MPVTRLEPSFREKVWGSPRLEPWFRDTGRKIGEVWFEHSPALPILVKFLYTTENLSVQVHPSGPCGVGKTEMWHILRVDTGAQLALGLKDRVSKERFREAALSGEIEQLLGWFPVAPGETYFVSSGTVHAIGAGITLCEIQQNSDITYRVYDYGRPRELHLEQAIGVSVLDRYSGQSQPMPLAPGHELLAECEWFRTERLDVPDAVSHRARDGEILVCLRGRGHLDGQPFSLGDAFHFDGSPLVRIEPSEPAQFLLTFVPAVAPVSDRRSRDSETTC